MTHAELLASLPVKDRYTVAEVAAMVAGILAISQIAAYHRLHRRIAQGTIQPFRLLGSTWIDRKTFERIITGDIE